MPNCFQLTRKSDLATNPKAQPERLNKIDEELCVMLGVEPSDTFYVACWFDTIGWDLAMGRSFVQILMRLDEDVWSQFTDEQCDKFGIPRRPLTKCCEYLAQHFTPDAWVEIGR